MDITSIININTFWNQFETNSLNPNNTLSDQGQIIYSHTYVSGDVSDGIDLLFNESNTLAASGGNNTYDLMSLTGSVFGNNVIKSFSYIKAIGIKNNSSDSSAVLDVLLNSPSGFGGIFGDPTGVLELYPSGVLYKNTTGDEYPVSTGERIIGLENNSSYPISYEISIWGND